MSVSPLSLTDLRRTAFVAHAVHGDLVPDHDPGPVRQLEEQRVDRVVRARERGADLLELAELRPHLVARERASGAGASSCTLAPRSGVGRSGSGAPFFTLIERMPMRTS